MPPPTPVTAAKKPKVMMSCLRRAAASAPDAPNTATAVEAPSRTTPWTAAESPSSISSQTRAANCAAAIRSAGTAQRRIGFRDNVGFTPARGG